VAEPGRPGGQADGLASEQEWPSVSRPHVAGAAPRGSFIQLIRYHCKGAGNACEIVSIDVIKDQAAGTREMIGVRLL
jgi:hypothetical protein